MTAFESSASGQYRFDSWTSDSGLPQNSVYSIAQTPDGYLWFTTLDGLVRYDGVRFTIFTRANTEGLIGNRFIKLFVDSDGGLWAGTADGIVTRMKEGRFDSFVESGGGLFSDGSYFRQAPGSSVSVSTPQGFFEWQGNGFTRDPASDSAGRTAIVYDSPSGNRWSLDLTGRLEKFSRDARNEWNITRPPGLAYVTMFEDSHSALWAGLSQTGLGVLRDGRWTLLGEKDGALMGRVRGICEDQQRSIWIAGEKGLARYRDGVFTTFTKNQGLPSDNIRCVFADREGTLWIGTNERGIVRASRHAVSVISRAQGLKDANIYPVLEDRHGDIWAGGYPGLYRISKDTGVTSFTASNITALFEDRDGTIWFGEDQRLKQYKDGRVVDISDSFALPKDSYYLQAMYRDRNGVVWFGATSALVSLNEGKYRVFTTGDGLPSNDVRAIAEDESGDLWFGTSAGVSRLRNGSFVNFGVKEGLPSDHVRSLYFDSEGVLWIGTYDGGLARMKNEKVAAITSKDGLYSDGVFQILEDDSGFFWMSSNRGLYRASRDQLNEFADGRIAAITCTMFGKEDGMLSSECNGGHQPAGVKMRDGRLLFPTQDGVVVVDPRTAPTNPLPPPVVLEDFLIDRKQVKAERAIEIAPGATYLDVRYTALSFIKPDQVRFKYMLDGLDSTWVEAGSRRTAYYSHLPPGQYTFRVIAANSDDVWNLEGASIRIIVIPPFYRTWWFQSLMALIVAGVVLSIFLWRLRRLKQAKAAQEEFSRRLIESQEGERKRIAAELHDSLGQSLAIIKNRALFGLNVPVDENQARRQFDEIASYSTQAIDEVKEIAYNLRPYLLDRLGLTKTIESMLNKVAASSTIRISSEVDQIDKLFTDEQEINLYRIIQESINNVIKHSEANEARVLIKNDTSNLEITIQDNGKGFSPEAIEAKESRKSGFGLIGIAERARILGGKPVIDSAPGRGTTIKLKLPLGDGAKGDAR